MIYRIYMETAEGVTWYVGDSTTTKAAVWSRDEADALVMPSAAEAGTVGRQLQQDHPEGRLMVRGVSS